MTSEAYKSLYKYENIQKHLNKKNIFTPHCCFIKIIFGIRGCCFPSCSQIKKISMYSKWTRYSEIAKSVSKIYNTVEIRNLKDISNYPELRPGLYYVDSGSVQILQNSDFYQFYDLSLYCQKFQKADVRKCQRAYKMHITLAAVRSTSDPILTLRFMIWLYRSRYEIFSVSPTSPKTVRSIALLQYRSIDQLFLRCF